MVEPVDDEGAPQRQTDHRVPLRVDGQLVQAPHLSQRRQLEKTTNVGFQKDQVLPEKVRGYKSQPLSFVTVTLADGGPLIDCAKSKFCFSFSSRK